MALDYHLIAFLALFFIFLGLSFLFILPLVICLILNRARKNGCPIVGGLSAFVSFCTSLAVILFALCLLTLSIFSWVPWWGVGILLTAYFIAVVCALRPWNRANWGFMLGFMIACIVLLLILGWVGAWLSHDICITSSPDSYVFYIDRRSAGDPCAKTSPKPCHTYLTFNNNASTGVIVHFHSSKAYDNPTVHVGTASGTYTRIRSCSRHKLDLEVDRYIYYGFLDNLTPDTTYYFVVGDGSNPTSETFIAEKKFKTAPVSGPFNFVTGGDVGTGPNAPVLLEIAANTEPLYISLGGDLAYANGIRACYPRWDAFLTMYENKTVTPTGYTVPIIAAPGNHEAGGWAQPLSNMRFYKRYFVQENLNNRPAQSLPLHHSHYISNQLLIALDSNVIETPASQVSWLSDVLADAPPGTLKTAIYHAPGYPSVRAFSDPESTGVRTHFVPVFDTYNLTAAFENHDHAYKRTKLLKAGEPHPSGTLYLGDGAFGVKPRPTVTLSGKPWMEVIASKGFFVNANVNETHVMFEAIDTNADVFDRVTVPIE